MTSVKILNAVRTLDRYNDSFWEADGLPKVSVISGITGIPNLTRSAINMSAPGITRHIPAAEPIFIRPLEKDSDDYDSPHDMPPSYEIN